MPARARGQRSGGGAIGVFRPSVREADPGQSPIPVVQQAVDDVPTPELRRQQEWEQRKLEQSLASERARLEREQSKELRSQSPMGKAIDEVRARQAAEKQAFEEHAAEQRQVLEQRHRKKIARPARSNDAGKPHGREKGKDKERGER